MAIQFARARYISRSTGGDAVRSSAYNARADLLAQRTGQLFYFKHRDAPEHHEILLPASADEKFADCSLLWNAAEAAERRKDSQVAREILLALPADPCVTDEDRIELARSFALTHFVSKGLAVQLDVHAPHEPVFDGEETGTPANHHAHLLITVRRLEGGVFAAKKATDLDPQVRACTPHIYGGVVKHGFVANALAWGELWQEHQDRYFIERGLAARVDPVAIHPGQHIGPVRMRQLDSELVERAELLRQANEEAARDPAQVLEVLTRNNATFSEKDLDRFLGKHIDDETQRAFAKRAVLDHPTTLALCDVESFAPVGRWTVREVRRQEQAALAEAEALAADSAHRGISTEFAQKTLAARQLREDQRAAFDYATGAGGLKLIAGRAGTGKSYTLQAIREAHERAGFRVIGLAPTNAVAQDLKAEGFAEAATIYAELFALKNGRAHWDASTVLIVDEAAMLDSRITGELLAAARANQAKLILAGDDKQLASIERGGLFTELKQRHGAAAITNVTRQCADWQRQAAMDLAEGRFIDAVTAFDTHGAISWSATQDFSRTALVETWKKDGIERPQSARFVFAYTNQDVDALNAGLRAVVREQGGLSGSDIVFETRHGALAFAVGDRVQFTETKKSAGLYNGNAGVITAIDSETGQLSARLDAVAGQGREVSWSAAEFNGFRHGYAGTIYKGQGKTLDRTYLYHTHHWRSAASYVALTRQRDSAQIFVARDTARNTRDLARQMARGEIKSASVAFATMEEVSAAREASLQELKARLAREPGALRRNLETWRIGEILRPVLPTLAQAIERQLTAVVALASGGVRLGGKVRAFAAARETSLLLEVASSQNAIPAPKNKESEAPVDRPLAAPRNTQSNVRAKEEEDRRIAKETDARQVQEAKTSRPASAETSGQRQSQSGHLQMLLAKLEMQLLQPRYAALLAKKKPVETAHGPQPLVPAIPHSAGQDCFGRRLAQAELAAVVKASRWVQAAKEDLSWALTCVYRDPATAKVKLASLEKDLGSPEALKEKLDRRNGFKLLGPLKGRKGWFASAEDEFAYNMAQKYLATLGTKFVELRTAEEKVLEDYQSDVEQQRRRDLFEIPGLSEKAKTTLEHLRQAGCAAEVTSVLDQRVLHELPRAAKASALWSQAKAEGLDDELEFFAEAVAYRFSNKNVPSNAPEAVIEAIQWQQLIAHAITLHEVHQAHEEHERKYPSPKPKAAPEAKDDQRPGPKPGPIPGF